MPSLFRITTAAALLFAVACTDSPNDPVGSPPTPTRLVIADPGVVRDGDVITLRATALTADDRPVANVPMQWSSVNPEVATVSPNGVLTALREGETEVVVVAGALQQRRHLQVVLHPATSIELTQTAIQLPLGTRGGVTPILRGLDGRQLLGRPITVESSNAAIVRISEPMELIPVAPGVATVTVRYGTLSASVQVTVPAPPPTGVQYDVRDVAGRALPAVIHEELIRDTGGERVYEVSKLVAGTVVIEGGYSVTLEIVHYQRVELMGNIGEREISRQVVRDRGQIEYNWIDGSATFRSTDVGGLTHALEAEPAGPRLRFREGGTATVWALGLQLK